MSTSIRKGVPVVAAKLRAPASDSYEIGRLDALMSRLWNCRLGLVVAPAGAGKTTLVSRFAVSARTPVAWYRCESWDVTPDHLLRHLHEGFASAFDRQLNEWATVEAAVSELEQWSTPGALLVIDDAHAIAGTPAEQALERFIDYAPRGLLTVIASRSLPGFNLSRLRVSGVLGEITGEDLRLRSWEVEGLFRDFYREPLPPVELAELARRTEGWAAGLQLFHLATTGKGLDERRRVLRALGGGSRLVREYLARNVLDELPPHLREFLIATCVLGRLNGSICDRFLSRGDSVEILEELERRQIFTTAVSIDGDYRYHEVLRSHLEHVLATQVGERGLRARYGGAGLLLQDSGAIPEALHAFSRAEDWNAVERLLDGNGAQLAGSSGVWLDALPPAVLEHDPWLLLASARRHRAEGRWQSAVETYQRAEKGFDGIEPSIVCQRERLSLGAWMTSSPGPAIDSSGQLRLAAIRDPLLVRAQLAARSTGQDRLAAGIASLLGGEVVEARRLLARASEAAEESDIVAAGARVGAAFAALAAGLPGAGAELEAAIEDADSRGQGFIARLGRASLALAGRPAEAESVRTACEHLDDRWGAAIAGVLQGWSLAEAGDANAAVSSLLDGVADRLHELGAPVLETWARSLLALSLAQRGDASALATALKAEGLANSARVDGPRLFIYAALARADSAHAAQFVKLAHAVLERTGLNPESLERHLRLAQNVAEPPLSIQCFADFRVLINGRPLAMGNVKPRTRALLRRLCADAGSPVHREALQDALWPDADADVAARNLHVAISSLRQALEPGITRGGSSLLVREGDSYRLNLPPGSEVDLHVFAQALERSRRARLGGDLDQSWEALQQAAVVADKELLPEDGSAPWVVHRRERVRAGLVETSRNLARALLANGQPALAAQAGQAAVNADRYDDASWRLLIEAREKAGDEAGARRAQAEYRRIVAELEPRPTGT